MLIKESYSRENSYELPGIKNQRNIQQAEEYLGTSYLGNIPKGSAHDFRLISMLFVIFEDAGDTGNAGVHFVPLNTKRIFFDTRFGHVPVVNTAHKRRN